MTRRRRPRRYRRPRRADPWADSTTVAAAAEAAVDDPTGHGARTRAMMDALDALGPEALERIPEDHVLSVCRVVLDAWLVSPISRAIAQPPSISRALADADAEFRRRGLRPRDVVVIVGADDTGVTVLGIERGGGQIRCTAPGGDA